MADGLEPADRLAELHALQRVLASLLEHRPRGADELVAQGAPGERDGVGPSVDGLWCRADLDRVTAHFDQAQRRVEAADRSERELGGGHDDGDVRAVRARDHDGGLVRGQRGGAHPRDRETVAVERPWRGRSVEER